MGETARPSPFVRTSGRCRDGAYHSRRGGSVGSEIPHALYVFYGKLETACRRSVRFDGTLDGFYRRRNVDENNIRFRIIGEMDKLPQDVAERLRQCITRTSANTGMYLVLALSYSSKWELTEAVKRIAEEIQEGKLAIGDITDKTIDRHLATSFMPDPDLLIRTGGEIRLSNYLLWQCAYSELYFCDTYWPDFKAEELCKAIYDYQQRERRFGKTSEQLLKR